jgi:hypothetical protein
MVEHTDIYELVERAAARQGIPRLELWQKTLLAIETGDLEVFYADEHPQGWAVWIKGARGAVDGYYDPNRLVRQLKCIRVRPVAFEKWLRGVAKGSGRPTVKGEVHEGLVELRAAGISLSQHPYKRLAELVAKRKGRKLGSQGWSNRTIERHVSDCRKKDPDLWKD